MPRQAITDTPTALANLTVGTRYTVQNRSGSPLFLQRATAAPTDADGAFVLGSGEPATVRRQAASEEIFIWNSAAGSGGGAVVYDEAA